MFYSCEHEDSILLKKKCHKGREESGQYSPRAQYFPGFFFFSLHSAWEGVTDGWGKKRPWSKHFIKKKIKIN